MSDEPIVNPADNTVPGEPVQTPAEPVQTPAEPAALGKWEDYGITLNDGEDSIKDTVMGMKLNKEQAAQYVESTRGIYKGIIDNYKADMLKTKETLMKDLATPELFGSSVTERYQQNVDFVKRVGGEQLVKDIFETPIGNTLHMIKFIDAFRTKVSDDTAIIADRGAAPQDKKSAASVLFGGTLGK